MTQFLTIRALHEEGVPTKTIARRLGLDPRTVRKHRRRLDDGGTTPQRASVPSKLDRWKQQIETGVEQGLSATQLYQDLCREAGFDASYVIVRRLVAELRRVEPEVYCRMQFEPGAEAQLDFGDIGRLLVAGALRRVYLFVMTLCFSRVAHYELVLDQRVPTFLAAIGRAFEFFGGVPARIKPDNLRSAVLIDRLGQRHYQEDFFRFCQHHGTVPDAARPHTPTDKGRVERDIRYAKGNFFRARAFDDLEHARRELTRWRDEVANVRLHGTTQRRPIDLFAQESATLRALPEEPFEICTWARHRVRKDCHVQMQGNWYSVPHRFAGQEVLLRLSEQHVSAFADGQRVAHHERPEARGRTVTDLAHYPATKRISTQEIHTRRVLAIRSSGAHATEFLGQLRQGRWVFGDQVALLAKLGAEHGGHALDRACRRALYFKSIEGARAVERILSRGLHDRPLPTDAPSSDPNPGRDFGRGLAEYDALLGIGGAA